MRIVHDAYWWVEGPMSNRSVQRAVIETWARDYPTDEITMIVPQAHLQAAHKDAPAQATLVGTRLRPHGLAAAAITTRVARRVGADAVLTHNFAAWRGRSAVFIHDVLFQSDPGGSRGRSACISRPSPCSPGGPGWCSRRRARKPLGSGRTTVDYATSYPLGSPSLLRYSQRRHDVLRVPDQFLLSVGRLNVRKNLATTIRAGLRSGVVTADRPLIVVGSTDGRDDALAADLASAVAERRIVVLDHVDDAELAWLYSFADLFVFLSLERGMG